MLHTELTCPFCNASLAGVVRGASDEPATCSRCGERLPATLTAQLPSEPFPAASAAAPSAARVPGKTKTLVAILAIMFSMAALATVFAYFTRDYRRQNDYRTQKKTEPGLAPTAAEASLLGFLPARCNVLAALHVSKLLQQPATRKLLDEPPLSLLVQSLPQWTGLKLSDFDQAALGAEIQSKLPQVVVVLQTRQPYVPAKVAAALAPAQPAQHRGKLLVRFRLQPVGEGLLWCHSERLLVLILGLDAVTTDDLDAVPPRPRPGAEGFAAPLRSAIAQRLPATSALWLAGHFDEPSAAGDLLEFGGKKNELLDALLRTKTFALSVQPQDHPTLTAHFFTGAAQASERLQTLLEARRWEGAQSYKVVGPSPDAEAVEQWVTLQARGDLAKGFASWQGK